jgi:hypothetical protein
MVVCCREMVAVVLHMFVPQKKFQVTGMDMPNAELLSFLIRLDPSQIRSPLALKVSERRHLTLVRFNGLQKLACVSVDSLFYWIKKITLVLCQDQCPG